MTPTIAKIIWLACGLTWFVLRFQPRQHSRKTPVRFSGRGPLEFALLAGSLAGLGIVPFVWGGILWLGAAKDEFDATVDLDAGGAAPERPRRA